MSTVQRKAIIIGGGVIGVACAYYLSQADYAVEIVEKNHIGKGCSHGNCGFICPSHVLPLTAPGMVRKTLKIMFRRKSPFYIKPRLDFRLWWWLRQFAKRCTQEHALAAAKAKQSMLNSSKELYAKLLEEEAIVCEWENRGLLFVYKSSQHWQDYAQINEFLSNEFNLPATAYQGDGVCELEPALKPGLAGGWHYQTDSHLRPDKLLSEWTAVLKQRSVSIRENCRVLGVVASSGKIESIRTEQGDITGDVFVFAAGALTPKFEKQLRVKIPIQPGKGYSLTMPRPAKCPKIPLMFEEHKVAVTPMQSAYRLGSTMEFSGYDDALNHSRLEMLKEAAAHYLYEPYCDPVEEAWCGWRPMTYDDLPIIGPAPLSNTYLAAGHGMLGLSMAPATGKLIAELVCGKAPHVDAAPFSASRFTA